MIPYDEVTYKEKLDICCINCMSKNLKFEEAFDVGSKNPYIFVNFTCNKCNYGFNLELDINSDN